VRHALLLRSCLEAAAKQAHRTTEKHLRGPTSWSGAMHLIPQTDLAAQLAWATCLLLIDSMSHTPPPLQISRSHVPP
jgi:hypothetical protein